MMNFTRIIYAISDHGNAAISKGLQYFGIGGSSVGGATWVATNKEVVEQGMQLSDFGAMVGIAGGLTLVAKNGIDIYFAYKRNGRETESHKRSNDK